MNINDYVLKLTGKASLDRELELGNTYILEIEGEIATVTDSNNDNGTKDRIYKFVPILCDILSDKGLQIKAKIPTKVSQQIRLIIEEQWKKDTKTSVDKEIVYQELAHWLRDNNEKIYKILINRLNGKNESN